MIRYTLKCADGHGFESWFASSAAYDDLRAAGMLACAVCGSGKVEKAIMAPALGGAAKAAPADGAPAGPAPAEAPADAAPNLVAPASPVEAAIRALRAKVEAHAEHVGRRFASEARAIHEGEAKARPIYGEASGEEAKALIEDGVEIAPLPWATRRDA